MSYIMIFITAIFVNNIVLSQFLGICQFLGVSEKISTSAGMGGAVMFVMVMSTIATYLIYHTLLLPNNLTFMVTVVFILVIAALVQMVEIILKKVSPALYQALGIFLPLITTNCTVLGVAILTIQKDLDLSHAVCFALANALGFTLAIICRIKGTLGINQTAGSRQRRADCLDYGRIAIYGFYGFCRNRQLTKKGLRN